MVVVAAAHEGLSHRPVVQYRAWQANAASLNLAARTGFTRYCDRLVLRGDVGQPGCD